MAKNEKEKQYPDQIALNKIQQKRLAVLADVDQKEIAGKNIGQLTEQLKWKIDPTIFGFRRICGRVVKKDPVTGVEYPVPFATVYVEDTDCDLLIYHPPGYPWCWHFPYFCHREIIGTTHTDACGNFCVWVPRFDIDWILSWRKHRICFPIVFRRPFIGDIISKMKWPPIPDPDPGPWEELGKLSPSIIDSIEGSHSGILKDQIARIKNSAGMGTVDKSVENILNKRMFDHEMPPPLPSDIQQALSGNNIVASKSASATDAFRSNIASHLGLDPDKKELEGFSHLNFIGPFYRCVDFFVPVWQRVVDVPDITFRVTQDTNGDGTEETIYSEGYFDVRWNSGPIPNVTLVASSIARETHLCDVPDVPCAGVPDILLAGFMPLRNNNYFDDVAGYAKRPNRPKPSGLPNGLPSFPANTPFWGVVQLYGCVNLQNAKYYRIKQSTDNGGSYSAITGLSWNNYLGSLPVPITADINGWYPVDPIHPINGNPIPRTNLAFENLVLDWPTPLNEKNLLKLELGDNSKNLISVSQPVAIVTDNTIPDITITNFSWKYVGEPDSALRNLNGIPCPMIKRGVVPQDVEVEFEVFVSAQHLRDAALSTSGCGDGSFVPKPGPGYEPVHWHETVLDNSEVLHQRYTLSASSMPGCYTFACTANSRTINPSGADGGNQLPTPDWFYEWVYLYRYLPKNVAVVNEDLS